MEDIYNLYGEDMLLDKFKGEVPSRWRQRWLLIEDGIPQTFVDFTLEFM